MLEVVMNKDIVQGNWKEIKGKLKQQWGDLTDDEIAKAKGTREELSGMLQKRYGYQKDRIEKEIDTFLNKNNWH
jgi:uncharacterized protein YjbJ (UPF0337 family)